jgi:hypothetical protein
MLPADEGINSLEIRQRLVFLEGEDVELLRLLSDIHEELITTAFAGSGMLIVAPRLRHVCAEKHRMVAALARHSEKVPEYVCLHFVAPVGV